MIKKYYYFIFHKPYNVLSQFSAIDRKKCLSDFVDLPKDVYPIGRLDYDSEGLLILTNNNTIKSKILSPKFEIQKKYLVQVEGAIDETQINRLVNGVEININGRLYLTKKVNVNVINEPLHIENRIPPIRFRKNIPTTWIEMIISEGKNRQIRKMTAKVGAPTLRLIRYSIENLSIDGLKSGEIKEIDEKNFINKIFLKKS